METINLDTLIQLMQKHSIGTGILAKEINEKPDTLQGILKRGMAHELIIAKIEAVLNGKITELPETKELPIPPFSRRVARRLTLTRTVGQLQNMVEKGILVPEHLKAFELSKMEPRKKLIKFLDKFIEEQ